jgi:hypothetical protein
MENSRDGTPGASDSSTNTGATTVEQDDGESPEEMIERLHKNIATLSSRCARLEAQVFSIPVQQLDIAARATALTLSLVSLYLYARLVLCRRQIISSGAAEIGTSTWSYTLGHQTVT